MHVVLVIVAALAALAQERSPAERQTLVDLAQVIGEAHALRQICNGPTDQFWRDRMLGVLEAEAAEYAFSERLRSAFNTGFVARQQRHLACTAETREAEASVAAEGQALARRLAAAPVRP